MSFPKRGKFLPPPPGDDGPVEPPPPGGFVEEVAGALRRSRRSGGLSVKQVAVWTGASEKTVKNWFAGRYGPNGAHLVELARHSDDVLGVFLALAGREHLMAAMKLAASEVAIAGFWPHCAASGMSAIRDVANPGPAWTLHRVRCWSY